MTHWASFSKAMTPHCIEGLAGKSEHKPNKNEDQYITFSGSQNGHLSHAFLVIRNLHLLCYSPLIRHSPDTRNGTRSLLSRLHITHRRDGGAPCNNAQRSCTTILYSHHGNEGLSIGSHSRLQECMHEEHATTN